MSTKKGKSEQGGQSAVPGQAGPALAGRRRVSARMAVRGDPEWVIIEAGDDAPGSVCRGDQAEARAARDGTGQRWALGGISGIVQRR